jgi:hypothetical protein
MTLKEYISELQKIEEKYPDIQLVYSSDAEGNRFEEVFYTPSLGHFEDAEFIEKDSEDFEDREINAVCIN